MSTSRCPLVSCFPDPCCPEQSLNPHIFAHKDLQRGLQLIQRSLMLTHKCKNSHTPGHTDPSHSYPPPFLMVSTFPNGFFSASSGGVIKSSDSRVIIRSPRQPAVLPRRPVAIKDRLRKHDWHQTGTTTPELLQSRVGWLCRLQEGGTDGLERGRIIAKGMAQGVKGTERACS